MSQQHKVISYNIRYGSANDGNNSWEFRRSVFYNHVNQLDLDIMGIQEGLHWQLQEMKYGLNSKYDYVGVGRDDGNKLGEYCAIWYHTEKYTILQHGTFWLRENSETPGPAFDSNVNRICTWAQLQDKNTKDKLIVHNAHFDWESASSQRKSVDLIIKFVKKWKSENGKIIVLGDFNADQNSHVAEKMRDAGFIDSFYKLYPNDKNSTFHDFTGKAYGGKIDFIWIFDKDFSVVEASIDQYREHFKFPSDHFAVWALLASK